MSYHTRSQSLMTWRGRETLSTGTPKARLSFDYDGGRRPSASSSLAPREGRDEMESSRALEISEEKVQKFDALLRKIETERKRMSVDHTPPRHDYDFARRARELRLSTDNLPLRLATPRETPKRSEREGPPSSYDYSVHKVRDTIPRSLSNAPIRSSSPIASRMSFDALPSRTGVPKRIETVSTPMRSEFSNRYRSFTPRSVGNTPIRSSTPPPSFSSPYLSVSSEPRERAPSRDFQLQVEKFHGNLVSAHDTISTLEKEVRNLKIQLEEKDDQIANLERRNKSLYETLSDTKKDSSYGSFSVLEQDMRSLKAKIDEKEDYIATLERRNESLSDSASESRKELEKVQDERKSLKEENSEMSNRYKAEIEKLRLECEGYRKHASDVDKLSSECDETVKAVQKAKIALENTVSEKDKMISSLRSEIKRLNEELADGSMVRAQAERAEEHAKKVESDLSQAKLENASANNKILDLEAKLKHRTEEMENSLKEKYTEIATLKAELKGGDVMKQLSERLGEKITRLESQLNEKNEENEQLANTIKELEQRLDSDGRIAKSKVGEIDKLSGRVKSLEMELQQAGKESKLKDDEIEKLQSDAIESQSRESELRKVLEKTRSDLVNQRSRFERFNSECAMEQETVTALEQAIEALEAAHNESNEEIMRLQKENFSLSRTLEEAEQCILLYKKDLQDTNQLIKTLDELKDANAHLEEIVQTKDAQIQDMHSKEQNLASSLRESMHRITQLENQSRQSIESTKMESQQRVLYLENQLLEKQGVISQLQNEIAQLKTSQHASRQELNVLQDKSRQTLSAQATSAQTISELRRLLEEKEAQLKKIESNKEEVLEANVSLQQELEALKTNEKDRPGNKPERDVQLEKAQKDASKAWLKVHELEESLKLMEDTFMSKKSDDPEVEMLRADVAAMKKKLAKRDEQLDESKKGITAAQTMIYKLMETVQELRQRAKEKESPE